MNFTDKVLKLFFRITEKVRICFFTNCCCCPTKIIKMHTRLSKTFQKALFTVCDCDIKIKWILSILSLVFGNSVIFFITHGPGSELRWNSFLGHKKVHSVIFLDYDLRSSCSLICWEKSFQLIRRHSEDRIRLQSSFKELSAHWTNVRRQNGFDMSVLDLSFEITLGFGSPWCFSGKHFIKDDSDGPDITFKTVNILIKSF